MFDVDGSDSDGESESGMQETIEKGFTVNRPVVDDQGYYQPQIGEIIHGKYKVTEIAGKGVFSCVVRAQILSQTEDKQPSEVAIKIMRTKLEVMISSGLKEKEIISRLN